MPSLDRAALDRFQQEGRLVADQGLEFQIGRDGGFKVRDKARREALRLPRAIETLKDRKIRTDLHQFVCPSA